MVQCFQLVLRPSGCQANTSCVFPSSKSALKDTLVEKMPGKGTLVMVFPPGFCLRKTDPPSVGEKIG